DERGTNLIFRNFRNTARVGKSDVSDEVVKRLAKPDAKFEDVAELVSGAAGKQVLQSGDLSGGMFWAGMVQGLIHDIPSVQELMDQIIDEATDILSVRLKSMSA
ncbi:MAG: nitronate monooxygenase, partial [Litorimonas sp.]